MTVSITAGALGEYSIASGEYLHLTDGDGNEFYLTDTNLRELITLLNWAEESL